MRSRQKTKKLWDQDPSYEEYSFHTGFEGSFKGNTAFGMDAIQRYWPGPHRLYVEFKQTTTTHITASTSSNSCRATVLQHRRWEKLVHSSIHLKEMADHESEQEQPQHYQSSAWVSTYSRSAGEHNSKEEEHFALPSSYRPSSLHTPILPRQKVPEVLESKAKPALLEGNVWKTNFRQIQHCANLRFVLVEFWTLSLLLIQQ